MDCQAFILCLLTEWHPQGAYTAPTTLRSTGPDAQAAAAECRTVVALAVASMSSVRAGPVLPNIAGLPHNFKAKDTMAKSLASMFLLKEGNVPNAQSALNVFSGVANANLQTNEGDVANSGSGSSSSSSSSSSSPTTTILGGAVTIPATTIPEKLAALAPNFTEIAGAMHPDLSYFTDPTQVRELCMLASLEHAVDGHRLSRDERGCI